MKILPLFLSALIVIVLNACSSEEPLTPNQNSRPIPTTDCHVSMSEALQRAEKMLDALDARYSLTRSSSRHRILLNIDCVTSEPITRSLNSTVPDTLYYIVNYANNDGFAVVSADNRTVPVYAISNEGNCSLKDTVFNKGLADYIKFMEQDIKYTLGGDFFQSIQP